jgi:ubiquinone biosynthesis protein COQ4
MGRRKQSPHIALRRRLAAVRAASTALLSDPSDTKQVFHILEALSFGTPARTLRRLRRSNAGTRLLDQRPSLLDALRDRQSLRTLPDGSLGREYLRFVEAEGIECEELVAASQVASGPSSTPSQDELYLQERMRDSHDLWHVVTGYGGDLLGEAALLAFTFSQTRHPGIGLLVLLGLLFGPPGLERKKFQLLGLWRGARARWLPEQPWEHLLTQPLDDVRQRLRIAAVSDYSRFSLSDYR